MHVSVEPSTGIQVTMHMQTHEENRISFLGKPSLSITSQTEVVFQEPLLSPCWNFCGLILCTSYVCSPSYCGFMCATVLSCQTNTVPLQFLFSGSFSLSDMILENIEGEAMMGLPCRAEYSKVSYFLPLGCCLVFMLIVT